MFEPDLDYQVTNERTGERMTVRGYQIGLLACRVLGRDNARLPDGSIADISGLVAVEHWLCDAVVCTTPYWRTALVLADELSKTAPETTDFQHLLAWIERYLPWIQWIASLQSGERPPTFREYCAGVRLVGEHWAVHAHEASP